LSLHELADFAVAVVVPDFGLGTADVYSKWDELEGPESEPIPDGHLPPSLRGEMPMRNDLLPAALALEPQLGDFMADVRSIWNAPVCLTGSGSACFGYFPSFDEATEASSAVSDLCSVARGVALRDHGVAPEGKRVE
jgi:4-diphosphocytidyl-2C-methyl-D-erythritol kinase